MVDGPDEPELAHEDWVLVVVPRLLGDPVHVRTITVRRHPVRVAEYRQFMLGGGYEERRLWSEQGWRWRTEREVHHPAYWDEVGYRDDDLPVTGISIWEAEAFAASQEARLPSEVEWEALATNGWTTRYPWGDEEDPEGERAHLTFFGALSPRALRAVDSFPLGRSAAGVSDLLGNVSEWCYLGATDAVSDQMTAVLRGGSSWHTPVAVDGYFRDEAHGGTRDNQTGIRLVRGVGLRGAQESAANHSVTARSVPSAPGRRLRRPTEPFRQEGIPDGLDVSTWSLVVSGPDMAAMHLSLTELQQLIVHDDHGLFVCVCRWGEVNRFRGVQIADLMTAIELPEAYLDLNLLQRSVPGPRGEVYESTIPVRDLVEHEAMLAWELDDEPLSLETGWPLRLLDLHLYGYKQVKCLGELVFTSAYEPGWWETTRGYDLDGTVRPGVITTIGPSSYRREIHGTGRVPISAKDLGAKPPADRLQDGPLGTTLR